MKDKRLFVLFRAILCMAVCTGTILLSTGCEDDDDDYDHDPPANMGSLIVDNITDNDVAVYIDGIENTKTDEDHWRAYDLYPGSTGWYSGKREAIAPVHSTRISWKGA